MSKFLKIMIVMLTIAAMAAPAIAEDRLSLGGQMRVWGWSLDNGTDTSTFMAQRLRTAGKISIAEGVSITFRSDITEATWGNGGNTYGSGRIPDGGTMQWDRAHIDLKKGNFSLRAGQQWAGYGMGTTINSEDTGLSFGYAGPVTISGFWFLSDQRGGTNTADAYVYAVKAAHKTDSYSGDIFLGGQNKENADGESAYVLGVDFTTNLNAIKLASELDFFFGDADTNVDAMGTQLFVDASMAASDMLTVGGQLYYALAAKDDGSEVQYQYLGNDYNGHDPIGDLGGNMYNEVMSYDRPFDFTGDNAGVMGVRIYGLMKANDALKLGAGFAYLSPEDDKMTTRDSDMVIGLNAQYAVMANTSLEAQVQFIAKDDTDNTVEDETQIGVGLFVSF